MTAIELRNQLRHKLRATRNLYGLVGNDKFEQTYDQASDSEKLQIQAAIAGNDQVTLSKILRSIVTKDLEMTPMRELRKLAQYLGVQHYSTMTKYSLLINIRRFQEAKSHNEKSTIDRHCQGHGDTSSASTDQAKADPSTH